MILVTLPYTKSRIVQKNDNQLFCEIYKNKRGWFRKDVKETKIFGRKVCDEVGQRLGNNGFFTSDELPKYGISEVEFNYILGCVKPVENDLVVFFAYSDREAKEANKVLGDILSTCSPY